MRSSTPDLKDFYLGKRVLVTGHTGFKGAWLSLWLERLGAEVTGFSLPGSEDEKTFFNAARIKSAVRHNAGDIRDAAAIAATVEACQPEIVFHLAAQPLVRESFRNPIETYSTNVLGTAHVLEAIRRCDATQSVVVVTTDKCYENRELAEGYVESDRLGGHDPYSSSKACAELVASTYRDSYFKAQQKGIATARAGNVIGGGDWAAERLVPDFVRGIQNNQPLVIRSPQAIRPWQHVLEPLCGYLVLARALCDHPLEYSSGWNFGPGKSAHINVLDLARRLTASWGRGSVEVATDCDSAMHETKVLALNCDKAKERLDWRPVLTIDETIHFTTTWYRESGNDESSARRIAGSQIAEYWQRAVQSSTATPDLKERVA